MLRDVGFLHQASAWSDARGHKSDAWWIFILATVGSCGRAKTSTDPPRQVSRNEPLDGSLVCYQRCIVLVCPASSFLGAMSQIEGDDRGVYYIGLDNSCVN